MKRIKLLLAAFAAMVGMSAYAQTDAQYDAAIAAIKDGGKYSIVAEYNSSIYYLKKDGYLTDKLTEAGVFTFTAASPSGAFKPKGFKTNQFTNGGAQNNSFSGDALKRIVTSGQNRDTWEAQAYFLNEEGYFAIRSTNAVSDSWGAGAYWTVVDDVDSDGLPNATYTMDDVPFVWKLQDGEIALAAIAKSHYNKKKAAALAVDDDTDAYEGEARVDLTDADAAVEAATTVEEIQAAETLIETAVGAFLEAVTLKPGYRFDITDVYLENTDFSAGNIGSWETNYVSGQQAQNIGYQGASYTNGDITISQFIESWLPAGDGNIGNGYLRQTVKALPEGQYSLEADGIAVKQNDVDKVIEGAYLFIYAGGKYYGKEKSLNTGNAKPEHFTTSFVHMGEGEIQFGLMTENATCNWLCADNFKVYYTGPMPLEMYEEMLGETLTAAQDYDKEVPKAALDALMEIADEQDKSWSSKEEYLAAITVINNAIEKTNTLIAPYADYKKNRAAFEAISSDIDFSAADQAAEASLTVEDLAAASALLLPAGKAYLATVEDKTIDLTDLFLTNPKALTKAGWEGTDFGGSSNGVVEYWNASGADFHQTLAEMPAGYYRLTAIALTRTDMNSHIYANKNTQNIVNVAKNEVNDRAQAATWFDAGNGVNELIFNLDDVQDLTIGLTADNTTSDHWTVWRGFKLEFLGTAPLSLFADELQKAIVAAKTTASELAVPAGVAGVLMGVAEGYEAAKADYTTIDQFSDAIDAIAEAVASAESAVAPAAANKAVLAKAETTAALTELSDAAKVTIQNVIDGNAAALAACTDVVAIEAQNKTLWDAIVAAVGTIELKNDEKLDLTYLLTNPDLTNLPSWAPADGWYTDQADGNSQVMNNDAATSEDGTKTKFYEYWSNPAKSNNTFALYQKVTLPAGTYAISCYAFAQDQYTGANTAGVYFYANDTQGSVVKNAKLTEANIDFVNAAEQEVKIGLKTIDPNTYNWMGIGYVTLAKVAPKTIDIAENVDYEPVSEAGKVNLIRTIKADTWNTFVVPFQITNDELKAAFGDDVEVAEESEVAHGDLSTISFTKMETPAITPNKPVLLKTSTAGTAYTFEGRTIATALNDVVGTNFDFVGTYASGKIAAGDYFIGSDKLFLSDGSVNVAGTHAYLKAKAAGVKAELFIDGVATAIESIDAETAQPAGAIYNVAGQRVQKAQRGLYIMGGKKVVVK